MTIEATIDSYDEIPDHAFRNSMIYKVVIPEGIEVIGKAAFKNCENLESVEFPSTLQKICTSAFEGCTSLRSVIIPEGVEVIQQKAFYGCTHLWKAHIPTSVRIIGPKAFCNTALYQASIPLVGANICEDAFPKDNAFYYTDETTDEDMELAKVKETRVLIIGEGVTMIHDYTFIDWNHLNTIVLPSTLTFMGKSCFPKKLSYYTIISRMKSLEEFNTFQEDSLYMNDDFVDEDTGEVIPIIRTFIKHLIVPIGAKEEYEEHDYFGGRIQEGEIY